jgi:hypothetical protein
MRSRANANDPHMDIAEVNNPTAVAHKKDCIYNLSISPTNLISRQTWCGI